MALTDELDSIRATIRILGEAINELSDKIDGIKPNRNEPCPRKEDLFAELTHLFELLAAGERFEAIKIVRRLTGCTNHEAQKMVESIDVINND